MGRKEEIKRIAKILKEECGACAKESGWCINVIASKLVDHPKTPIRSVEGFEIKDIAIVGGSPFKIEPIKY